MSGARRVTTFVVECVLGITIAGVLMGVAIPLAEARGYPLRGVRGGIVVVAVLAVSVLVMTLRRGGSLRR